MNYYQDLTLISNTEINLAYVWQKVFQQVHLALVEMKTADGNSDIAVSFPEYEDKDFPLGNKLRLFASTQAQLLQLDISKRLNRLTDYCHYTSIKEVPKVDKYACFNRKQFKTNVLRRARRRIKSTGETIEQASNYLVSKGFTDKESKLPYINLESKSTAEKETGPHKFRLFIERKILTEPEQGDFNCYGLSNHATVPWFD